MSTKTSEVLDLAADKIQQHGWTKGSKGWPLDPDNDGSLCLEGAIMAALGLNVARGDLVKDAEFIACPAYLSVREYLGGRLPDPEGSIFWWNDGVAESANEVIEVLRAAAAVERVKEASYSTEDEPLPLEVVA